MTDMRNDHIMIDLETLGTRPGSVILTIGAVRFDPTGKPVDQYSPPEILDHVFYRRIQRDSCVALGLTDHADTLAWWGKQSHETRHEAFDAGPRYPIAKVMRDFTAWCGTDHPHPWSHGASFDISHCEDIFSRLSIRTPWNFWDIRDTRTLYAFTGEKPDHDHNHHHAIHDAIAQAAAVQRAHAKRGKGAS